MTLHFISRHDIITIVLGQTSFKTNKFPVPKKVKIDITTLFPRFFSSQLFDLVTLECTYFSSCSTTTQKGVTTPAFRAMTSTDLPRAVSSARRSRSGTASAARPSGPRWSSPGSWCSLRGLRSAACWSTRRSCSPPVRCSPPGDGRTHQNLAR